MKKLLKVLWAWFWSVSHFLDFYLWMRHKISGSSSVVILLYHRVVPKKNNEKIFSLPGIVVHEDSFEKQMRFLSENYNVIPLNSFLEASEKQIALPPQTVVITFDDGWEDNYLYAFPILKKYKLPATIFLTTGFIETKKLFWQEKVTFLVKKLFASPNILTECFERKDIKELQPLLDKLFEDVKSNQSWFKFIESLKFIGETKRDIFITGLEVCLDNPELPEEENSFLKWEQIKEMKKYQISFGSHGVSHEILTEAGDDRIMGELELSKQLIEKELGVPVNIFSYPNGNYNEKIIKKLSQAGYESALTVEKGINTRKTDLYRLKRINIHEGKFSNLKGNFSEKLFAIYLACLL